MLLEVATASSVSSGVGRGGGNWMLVKSGREPPVLWGAGISDVINSWSGDGNILTKTEEHNGEDAGLSAVQFKSSYWDLKNKDNEELMNNIFVINGFP